MQAQEISKDVAVEQALKKGIDPYKSRFQDAPWFDCLRNYVVNVLGCGGIGSFTIFGLARIGCPMIVYDMDLIETHNLGGQLFGTVNIGQYKTAAIQDICRLLCGDCTIVTCGKFEEGDSLNGITIAAFDNMASRKIAFEAWKKHVKELKDNDIKVPCVFIDGRLMAEDYQVYVVTPDRIEDYEKTLFDDSEVADLPCTLKSTTHCSMAIASEIVAALTNYITNFSLGMDIRVVPFCIVKSIMSYTYEVKP